MIISGRIDRDASVLYAWVEERGLFGLQLLKDKTIAEVDHDLNVLRSLTLEEARALKASVEARIGLEPGVKHHRLPLQDPDSL